MWSECGETYNGTTLMETLVFIDSRDVSPIFLRSNLKYFRQSFARLLLSVCHIDNKKYI